MQLTRAESLTNDLLKNYPYLQTRARKRDDVWMYSYITGIHPVTITLIAATAIAGLALVFSSGGNAALGGLLLRRAGQALLIQGAWTLVRIASLWKTIQTQTLIHHAIGSNNPGTWSWFTGGNYRVLWTANCTHTTHLNSHDETALHVAIRQRDLVAAAFLLKYQRVRHHIEEEEVGGCTPLHLAINNADLEAIELLLAHGADKTAQWNNLTDMATFVEGASANANWKQASEDKKRKIYAALDLQYPNQNT